MPDYREIYFHNRYEIALDLTTTFTFSLSSFNDTPFFDRAFAIITASNPDNSALSEDENGQRNRQLYSELNSLFTLLPAKGCLDNHCEEGFLVFDMTLAEALQIGRHYEQYAVFYNTTQKLIYAECQSEKIIIEKERVARQSR